MLLKVTRTDKGVTQCQFGQKVQPKRFNLTYVSKLCITPKWSWDFLKRKVVADWPFRENGAERIHFCFNQSRLLSFEMCFKVILGQKCNKNMIEQIWCPTMWKKQHKRNWSHDPKVMFFLPLVISWSSQRHCSPFERVTNTLLHSSVSSPCMSSAPPPHIAHRPPPSCARHAPKFEHTLKITYPICRKKKKKYSIHYANNQLRLGSATLSQLAFLGERDPNFPMYKIPIGTICKTTWHSLVGRTSDSRSKDRRFEPRLRQDSFGA